MHIKQIIIQNFQSYKYEVIDDISPYANLILGKNGHGKSNIINAVMFVLTNKYSLTRDEERRAILNNGANPDHDIISVEIRFDNKDRKIPVRNKLAFLSHKIDEDTISLKRVVNPDNKSEHRLNDRAITRNELDNILNCCGLSRNNPYNVIQQGKISKIAQMNEKELYNLLQEIIGTNQYEQKKTESIKYLDETTKEIAKTKEMLKEIKRNIEDLEAEKEIYEEYTATENQARGIEFCIYQRHITEIQEKLTSLTTNLEEAINNSNNAKTEEIEHINYLEKLKSEIQQLKFKEQSLLNKENALNEDLRELQYKREKTEFELSSFENGNKQGSAQKSQVKKASTQDFTGKIEDLNQELTILNRSIQEKLHDVRRAKDNLRVLSKQLDTVYMSKGPQNFETRGDKNKYYDKLIGDAQKQIQNNNQQIKDSEEEIKKNKKTIAIHNERLKELEAEIKKREGEFETVSKAYSDNKSAKVDIASRLKTLIYQMNQDTLALEEHKKSIKKIERSLELALKDNSLYTIESILKIVKEENIQGVYGLFIDLIDIQEKLHLCCDIALKNKLFGFVVDDYKTADVLLSINRRIKGSTINIYPLSWVAELKTRDIDYPTTSDAIIVKNHIKQKPGLDIDLSKLIDHVFGKLLLVRDYNVATTMAKKYNLNCVTADGEVVYAGSYLSKLGFYDIRNEKISLYEKYRKTKNEIEAAELRLAQSEQEKNDLSNQDLQVSQKAQQLSLQKADLSQKLANMRSEYKAISDHNMVLEKIILEHEGYIILFEDENSKLKDQIELYQKERDDPTLTREIKLSPEDTRQIEQINTSVEKAKSDLKKAQGELNDLQNRHKEVTEQLERTRQEFHDAKAADTGVDIDLLRKELVTIQTKIANNTTAIQKNKEERDATIAALKEKENELQKAEDQKGVLEKKKLELDEKVTQLNFKKGEYLELKEAYNAKINQMDHVKSDMISQYRNKTIKELLSMLENLRRDKKKFTSKDQALFERLGNLSEKYETNKERLNELEKNEEETYKLIQSFDANTQERISKVFKTFSNHFQNYFSKITQGGKAEAKLLKEKPKGRGRADAKYFAISINVKFHGANEGDDKENQGNIDQGDEDQWTSMASLSAGQKTVVTIALIFALQRCDPAPFYFLDEFDAALDASYRRNIAYVIHENSKYSQYFITTFKPELLYLPNARYFEVKFQDLISKVTKLDQNKAKELLAQIGSETKEDENLIE